MDIIYKPDILKILTGNTSSFYDIEPNITITSGFTLNVENFNNNNISKIDIIDNVINYIDVINKYAINVKISNSGSTFEFVTTPDIYCVMFSGDTIHYLIMEISLGNILTTTTTTKKILTTTTTTTTIPNGTNIKNPIIYYNSGVSWNGGYLDPPRDVFLYLTHDNIRGWNLSELKVLFINNIKTCFNDEATVIFDLFKSGSNITLTGAYENGIYDIFISVKDSAKNTTSEYILNIIVNEKPTIIYKSILDLSLTGNTNSYYGIEPNITIYSGFTLSLDNFNDYITKNDIIDNVINYIENVYEVNKYAINVNIYNSGETFDTINKSDNYCVVFSYENIILDYLIMSVILGQIPTTTTSTTTTTTTIISIPNGTNISQPTIYYNSGHNWLGGGLEPPHDAYLHLSHDDIIGWSLDSLILLFIDKIVGCLDNDIPLSAITINLFKRGSDVPLNGIYENGIYDIFISVKDSAKNTTSDQIINVIVNDLSPIIFYHPYILNSGITGNTSMFSGATSGITSNIPIDSGFTFNLGGFDGFVIDRLDIIDNIVNYVIDPIYLDINKYMLDILIVGRSHRNGEMLVYKNVTKPGKYCIKISLSNRSGNNIVNYFIMDVVFDVSIYSEGYWQDNKVWIDFTLWLDHSKPIWAT